jgi:hypothetical protein
MSGKLVKRWKIKHFSGNVVVEMENEIQMKGHLNDGKQENKMD